MHLLPVSFKLGLSRAWLPIRLKDFNLCDSGKSWFLIVNKDWTNFKIPLQKCSLWYHSFSRSTWSPLGHRETHPTLPCRYGCGKLHQLLRFNVSFFMFCFRQWIAKLKGKKVGRKLGASQTSNNPCNSNWHQLPIYRNVWSPLLQRKTSATGTPLNFEP